MKFIADLHLHSRFARACSKQLTLENMDAWCRVKGVNIAVCADFTHPKWFAEIKKKLTPSKHEGLYVVKLDEAPTLLLPIPLSKEPTLFMIGTEVACIYSDRKSGPEAPITGRARSTSGASGMTRASGSKVRRVHHCIFSPTIEVAEKINKALEARGAKLGSDGRPILGMSSQDLLKLVLDADPRCVLVPVHIWTPWFAIFGSFSGFDSVEECFGDLTKHIFALETGLSSDPPMNWRKSELDNYALVSSSDAHSLPNIGREANVFEGDKKDLSYDAIWQAVRDASPSRLSVIASNPALDAWGRGNLSGGIATSSPSFAKTGAGLAMTKLKMAGTIEFIPDEGRYHYDGHRACKARFHPHETKKLGGICPKCKKKMTIGVLSRVEDLADLPHEREPKHHPRYWNIVGFDKLIAEAEGINGRKAKAVERQYWDFLAKSGASELDILMNFSREKLENFMPPIVVEAIMRMREGRLTVDPGYDGEYGIVKIFNDKERKKLEQRALF